jgi:predicted kinase
VSRPEGLPVVLITGAPATGKSTLGRLLARRLHAALIDQDVATGPLVDVIQQLVGITDLDDERLARLTREARYETITALAIGNLSVGIPVVLVAPYTRERADQWRWAELAARLVRAGGAPLLVWLSLDPARILERLRARGAHRDRAKVTTAASVLAALGSATVRPAVPHLALSADQAPQMLLRRILDALDQTARERR